jgi:hypothetical protein
MHNDKSQLYSPCFTVASLFEYMMELDVTSVLCFLDMHTGQILWNRGVRWLLRLIYWLVKCPCYATKHNKANMAYQCSGCVCSLNIFINCRVRLATSLKVNWCLKQLGTTLYQTLRISIFCGYHPYICIPTEHIIAHRLFHFYVFYLLIFCTRSNSIYKPPRI